MNITEEMVKAGANALKASGALAGSIWAGDDDVPEGVALAILRAAAPLIAAQALRLAAEDVRDNHDVHSHGDRCSYGPPGECDCERGATYRWLIARAAGRCGAPDPHRGVEACVLDCGHAPDVFHRYGRVLPCPTCSGPKRRETVGMVCQTCGTDYAPDTP